MDIGKYEHVAVAQDGLGELSGVEGLGGGGRGAELSRVHGVMQVSQRVARSQAASGMKATQGQTIHVWREELKNPQMLT